MSSNAAFSAVEITGADPGSVGQPVLATEHDEELLAEERQIVKPLVDLVRPAIDGGLQSATGEQRGDDTSQRSRPGC